MKLVRGAKWIAFLLGTAWAIYSANALISFAEAFTAFSTRLPAHASKASPPGWPATLHGYLLVFGPMIAGLIFLVLKWPEGRNAKLSKRPRTLDSLDETVIRQHALRRLASVFGLDATALSPAARFGEEIKAGPVSYFKANEFDIIDDDIRGVSDKSLLKALGKGEIEIHTVGDYCDHMVRCHAEKPKDVARLLLLPSAKNSEE